MIPAGGAASQTSAHMAWPQLHRHFLTACTALSTCGAGPGLDRSVCNSVWSDILTRHQEPHRHYHTCNHLQAMMDWLCGVYASEASIPAPTVFAVLFHDCVYDPTRADNEDVSAQVAAGHLQALGASEHCQQQVCAYIHATKSHTPTGGWSTDPHLLLFLDADLSVLAQPRHVYQAYASGVRQEYLHVEDQAFREGRLAVLNRLLQRPCLYFSAYAQDMGMEGAARQNLAQEVQELMS